MQQPQKIFIFFIIRFLGSYAIMVGLYQQFLFFYDQKKEVDIFTQWVASHVLFVNQILFENATSKSFPSYHTIALYIHNQPIGNIVEGCNAINIIILFISFVLAFYQQLKHTLYFLIIGSISIYLFNIIRIVLMCSIMYNDASMGEWFHQIVFPVLLYGYVALLWWWWIFYLNDKK